MRNDGEVVIGINLDSKNLDKDLKKVKRTLEKFGNETDFLEKENENLFKERASLDMESYYKEIEKLKRGTKLSLINVDEKEREKILAESSQELENINKKYENQINKYNSINDKVRENQRRQKEIEASTNEINQALIERLNFKPSFGTEELKSRLNEAEKILEDFEKENEDLLKIKAKIDLSGYHNELEALKQEHAETTAYVTDTATKNMLLDQENEKLQKINDKYSLQINLMNRINREIQTNADNQELVRQKIIQIDERINKIGSNPLKNINSQLKTIGKSVDGITHKMVKWTLAMFGIRGAYTLIRRAMSMVSSQNEEVAGQMQQMRNVIAEALYPVVNQIVNLVARLMVYINLIFKAITGKDLFNFSAAMKNSEKNSGKMAKNLKDAKKQLAGFDEMNVLSDTSSSGNDSVGNNTGTPNIFDQFKDLQLPPWLDKLLEYGDLIEAAIGGITAALMAMKLFGLDPILSLGIGAMIGGLIYAVKKLIDYLKNPSWENFGGIIQGIGVFVVGLGIAFLGLPAIITGVAILILGTIIKYWDKIKVFLQSSIDWLKNQSDFIHQYFGDKIGYIYDIFVEALQGMLDGLDRTFKGMKYLLDETIKFIKNVFSGKWREAWQNAKNIFKETMLGLPEALWLSFKPIINKFKEIGTKIGETFSGSFKSIINTTLGWIEKQLNKPIDSINGLINKINDVPGINISKLSSLRLPRLAKGGIINQPSRGVAIGGESGMEGVIPLTDSQQMRLLGESIGRYITIQLTNINSMNGRVISKELKKIENENNFMNNF